MNIKKIIIHNFYSFKHVELDLGKYKGITMVKGKNHDSKGSNGSGKSALFEAIFFGLTGKTIRNSIEEGVVNNQEGRGCMVEVHLNDNIVIRRQKRPTKLELIIDGKNCNKSNAIETQAEIDRLLNTNYKLLSASMFFGQSNEINFLDSTAEDKRTIIRSFLNLDDMFQYRDRIRDYKSHFLSASKVKASVIDGLRQNKNDAEKKISIILENKKKYDGSFDAFVDMTIDDVVREEKEYKTNNNLLFENKAELIKTGILLETKLTFIKRYEQFGPRTEEEVCHECGLAKKHTETEADFLAAKDEVDQITKKKEEIEKRIEEIEKKIVTPKISSEELSNFFKYKELCKEQATYNDIISGFEDKINNLNRERATLDKKYEVMRFWEKAFSEQGVIKYIIRNILSYLNERTNYYLSFLTNSKYFLLFDEELNEKITTNGKEVHYISLSGGEKRKMNLAVMLALRDLLVFTDKDKTNLLFFDEVAENLDDDGVYGLYLLLEEIKKDRNVFIITHNKHLESLLDSCKKINISKKNGVSKITR